MIKPLVSILIVNYNGKQLTRRCLTSLEHLKYPKSKYEVIVVDNNSHDLSVEMIREEFPWVTVVPMNENSGFSKGNNIAAQHAKGKYLVFLNNDTEVLPNWLSALVETAEADDKIGAVNSKILGYYPFVVLDVTSNTHTFSEFTNTFDMQSVGVQIEELFLDNAFLQPLITYFSGFLKKDKSTQLARWTDGNAQILLPFDRAARSLDFIITLRAQKSLSRLKTNFSLKVGSHELLQDSLDSYQVKQYEVSIPRKVLEKNIQHQVTNAGNVVFSNGQGRDRGAVVSGHQQSYELDNSFYDKLTDVTAFCGASALVRAALFKKLGGFDEDFFMYYEDVDYSFRLQRLGYKIVYQPKSVVYHHHAASSGEWSSFFILQVEKNYMLFLLKHFPLQTFVHAYFFQVMLTSVTFLKMIKWRIIEHWELFDELKARTKTRLEILRQVAMEIPKMLKKRQHIINSAKVESKAIYAKLD